MTIGKRNKIDRFMRSASRAARFIKYRINRRAGRKLQEWIDNAWYRTFD